MEKKLRDGSSELLVLLSLLTADLNQVYVSAASAAPSRAECESQETTHPLFLPKDKRLVRKAIPLPTGWSRCLDLA
jgi:hypothetical protein